MVDSEDELIDDSATYGSTSTSSKGSLATTEDTYYLINDVYKMIGFGRAQILYYILIGLVSYSDWAELSALTVIMPLLRCEWGLTVIQEAGITMVMFGSYAICALIFGKLTDKYGRKPILKFSLFLIPLSGAISGLAPNVWVFAAGRMVTGCTIGVNIACMLCYGTEFAESKHRANGAMVWNVSAYMGMVMANLVAYLLLQRVGWRWYVMLMSLPAFPAVMLTWVLPGSPRFLVACGKQDKALEAVRFMAKLNKKRLPDNMKLVCYETEDRGSFSMILNREYRRTSILLAILFFCLIFIEFGFIVFQPLLLASKKCGTDSVELEQGCKILDQEDLWDLTISSSFRIGGSLLGLLAAQHIGRLIPLRVSSGALVLAILTLFRCVSSTFTFASISVMNGFDGAVCQLLLIMIPESFPTIIRSTGIGFVNAVGKVGGVIGSTSAYLLFYVNIYAMNGLFLTVACVLFVASLLHDNETKDITLQES